MDSSKQVSASGNRRPPAAGKGRPKGSLNKTTREFRDTVTQLLSNNADNVALWLEQVASGNGNPDKADPGKALDLMSKLAEYAAPKLARTEVSGPDGEALTIQVVRFAGDPTPK